MADPAGPNGWDIAAVIGGVVTVLGVIGKGIGWLLAWGDRRQRARMDRLAREEGELAEGWSEWRVRVMGELHEAQAEIRELKDKIGELEQRDIARTRESAIRQVAYEAIRGALHAIDPGNIALRHADQILAAVFPIDPHLPPDMRRSLDAIDAADAPPQPEGG